MGHEVKRRAGYTLIELMLVMVVLAAASLVVAPAVGRAVDGMRVRSEVAGVTSLLRWAREQAVTRGRPQEVTLELEGRALLVRSAGAGLTGGEKRRLLSPIVQIVPTSGRSLAPIIFMPQGQSSGASFRIETSGRPAYVVTVDALTGRVSARRADS